MLAAPDPSSGRTMPDALDEVLEGRLPTPVDLPRLPITCGVFAESLRLFPPAWIMNREAVSDQRLDGYPVRAGATVLVSPYVIQRDARFHADPDRFDPERLRRAGSAPMHPYAFFPFGGGPMRCVGDHFAWMEAPLVLATLAQRWRLRPLPERRPVRFSAMITLKPRGGLPMITIPGGPKTRAGGPC